MFIHVDISFLIAFIDNSIITYGWRDTIGKSDFCRKNHKKHLTRVQNYAMMKLSGRGGGKAGKEIVLDVIQVVLAAILVVLVYKLYKKQ